RGGGGCGPPGRDRAGIEGDAGARGRGLPPRSRPGFASPPGGGRLALDRRYRGSRAARRTLHRCRRRRPSWGRAGPRQRRRRRLTRPSTIRLALVPRQLEAFEVLDVLGCERVLAGALDQQALVTRRRLPSLPGDGRPGGQGGGATLA